MIERILKFAIDNRILIVLFTVAASFYGLNSLRNLPIDAVPDITNNQVQINTVVNGLSPEQVEKQITFVIENALRGIPGLESTRSISRSGFSQVTAIFNDHVNIYFARQQITEKLMDARESLPAGSDPEMGPIATGLSEVYFWSVEFDPNAPKSAVGKAGMQPNGDYLTPEGLLLTTDEQKLAYLRTVQDWIIKPQLIGMPGLAGVDSIGGYVMQVQVVPLLDKLNALGLSLNDLVEAVRANHKAVGAGYVEIHGEALLVKSDAQLRKPEELLNIFVAIRDGHPIHLRDVATVAIGREERSGSASKNGNEVVIGTAMMRIGENSRTIAGEVDTKIDVIQSSLPPQIHISKLLDRSKLVNATIHTVVKNLAEGALLVIAVLFFMLHNIPAALICAAVIPIAMLLTSIGMVNMHISGNLMSLGALDFGLIVDGAIIIAENCLRALQTRSVALKRELTVSERLDTTLHASSEMIKPSLFGQGIIMFVYLPLFTLTGVEGKIFTPMAATVLFALLAALVLSFTFVPAMIALFVKESKHVKNNAFDQKLQSVYKPILHESLLKPRWIIAGSLILVISSLLIYSNMGQEFTPTLDEQDIAVQATRGPSTSLSSATAMQREVEKALLTFEEVEKVYSKTGTAELASDPMPMDASDTFVIFKPRSAWPDPARDKVDLIEAMEAKLKTYPGNNFEFTQPIQMRFNELIGGVKSDVAVKIYGDDLAVLEKVGDQIARVVKTLPGAADVTVETPSGSPELDIEINREALSRYGLNSNDVLETMAIAFSGGKAGELYQGDRRYDIVVRLSDEKRNSIESLRELPIILKHSQSIIPLKEVATITQRDAIGQVSREEGKRMVTVQANVRGVDLSSFIETTKAAIAHKIKVPSGYWIDYGGQFTQLLSAKERLKVVVPICLLFIFMLLYMAIRSFKEALIIFSGIPLAMTGGVYGLYLMGMPFSISAAVGFIALSGIAVLNGLVLVTTIQHRISQGSDYLEAIETSCLTRLRPVLMTALVASLGFLPMALATGAGAEVQKPIAIVVIGGLISSTALTLLVLPALYRLLFVRKEHATKIVNVTG